MVFAGNLWKMKLPNCGPLLHESPSRRLYSCNLLPALCILLFIGTAVISFGYNEKVSTWEPPKPIQTQESNVLQTTMSIQITDNNSCKTQCNPSGSEPLPKGIVTKTSDLEMRTLEGSPCSPKKKTQCNPSGSEPLPKGIVTKTSDLEMQTLGGSPRSPKKKGHKKASKSLLVIAVGIKQKEVVDQIVKKFSSSKFSLVLFHYDGFVNEWSELPWSDNALHISAANQTKWWFAKRFLHPDIVAEYDYIFLWDEDLGVEHFDPNRYLSIVRREGLEISQPGLDTSKTPAHYRITARQRKGDVHRRVYQTNGGARCYWNSTAPPCTGWVEMMAPVFSRASWRCVWHMIQNDLIHAWGLDKMLGYCAQGDRTKTVGVVDSEYIIHKGLPTLGARGASGSSANNARLAVRKRSYAEQEIFKNRWEKAAAEDHCWTDPFPEPSM